MDTRDKRASALSVGLAFIVCLPLPDGLAFDQGDRQQVSALYRGIAAASPAVPTPGVIDLAGSYVPLLSLSGFYAPIIDTTGEAG